MNRSLQGDQELKDSHQRYRHPAHDRRNCRADERPPLLDRVLVLTHTSWERREGN